MNTKLNSTSPLAAHKEALRTLRASLRGKLDLSTPTQLLYATDASIYKEIVHGVAFPQDESDIARLLAFAKQTQTPLIARGAGTSLAGQVVGKALIVDVSLYMHKILEVNTEEKWVRVQPGVIRDDLNAVLKPYGYFFAPETASASRATIGGMIGNNSTGANSIVYGATRAHIIALQGFLANGEPITVEDLSLAAYSQKLASSGRERHIYCTLDELLRDPRLRAAIEEHFPHPEVTRRNTGYALDALMHTAPFTTAEHESLSSSSTPSRSSTANNKSSLAPAFNLAKLIAGSEGTLMFISEAKLKLTPLPPAKQGIIAAHFHSIDAALRANLIALNYAPSASELIDHYIIECTERNIEQRANRTFIKGTPQAILIIELRRDNENELNTLLQALQKSLLSTKLSYHAPILSGIATQKPWNLRKAGLGLLSNVVGDAKPIALVEDAAVRVEDLPKFVKEFNVMLKKYGFSCVHYAHAGAGELHLRPIVNIKTAKGKALIRDVATASAHLVKKYRGSLSGEHGDGRLRSEFIPLLLGETNYQLLKRVKACFDPENLLNPHKITNAPPMNTQLRYDTDDHTPHYDTYLDFSPYQGIVRLAEMCNGSGECRRSHLSSGLMCPSYMATRDERHTTRARANILREILKNPNYKHPFQETNVLTVLDLCLSCKGCKAQCPSSVDIAALKAEYLSHYYEKHRPSLRTLFFAYLPTLATASAWLPAWCTHIFLTLLTPLIQRILNLNKKKPLLAFSKKPAKPRIHARLKNPSLPAPARAQPTVYFFNDEYSNSFASDASLAAVKLLQHLGYRVKLLPITNSGRSLIIAGFLKSAQKLTQSNLAQCKQLIADENTENFVIVGIEPSALLTFRDEHIALLRNNEQKLAKSLAQRTFLLEEFLHQEFTHDHLNTSLFVHKYDNIAYHVHCHQQALSKISIVTAVLNLISNNPVISLGQGCCGMAGTFGYESEHAAISEKIAALRLLPNLKQLPPQTVVVATGLSCRDQISFLSPHQAISSAQAFYQTLDLP